MLRYLKTILREYLSTLPHPPPTANIVCCGRPHLDDHHDLAKEGRKEVRGANKIRKTHYILFDCWTIHVLFHLRKWPSSSCSNCLFFIPIYELMHRCYKCLCCMARVTRKIITFISLWLNCLAFKPVDLQDPCGILRIIIMVFDEAGSQEEMVWPKVKCIYLYRP
jgi:hypothetical protein